MVQLVNMATQIGQKPFAEGSSLCISELSSVLQRLRETCCLSKTGHGYEDCHVQQHWST